MMSHQIVQFNQNEKKYSGNIILNLDIGFSWNRDEEDSQLECIIWDYILTNERIWRNKYWLIGRQESSKNEE